jgi:hypothetical protein
LEKKKTLQYRRREERADSRRLGRPSVQEERKDI